MGGGACLGIDEEMVPGTAVLRQRASWGSHPQPGTLGTPTELGRAATATECCCCRLHVWLLGNPRPPKSTTSFFGSRACRGRALHRLHPAWVISGSRDMMWMKGGMDMDLKECMGMDAQPPLPSLRTQVSKLPTLPALPPQYPTPLPEQEENPGVRAIHPSHSCPQQQ